MTADMEVNEHNIKMKTAVLLILFAVSVSGRVHKLKLEDDSRKQITLSTFGFLSGGTLTVNITHFSMKLSGASENSTMFGFTLDKSQSSGLSSYMEAMQNECILTQSNMKRQQTSSKDNVSSIFFSFDFQKKKVKIQRVGGDMQKLMVSDQARKHFLTAHNLNRRDSDSGEMDSKFSDQYLMGNRRKLRAVAEPKLISDKTEEPQTEDKSAMSSSTSKPVKPSPTVAASLLSSSAPPSSSLISQSPNVGINLADNATPNKTAQAPETLITDSKQSVSDSIKTASQDMNQEAELHSVDLKMAEDGSYQTYFLVYIQRPDEEGLYNLFFHNCLGYKKDAAAQITMTLEITEDNNGNFLTAGEMPVPALYFTFSVLFFIAAVAWLSVLRRSQQDVYKIHYLMLVVVFVKSLSCLFHGMNMYFIQIKGIHEDAWAVMWYIVYLMRGALMFVTVLLIGAGWAFIKHVLTDREKKLFLIIIPLQVLDRVAEVIVEESEEGNQSYMTWKEIFILVDLLCCGAILFPVVWSIRHLQEASRTDGKAAINLQKLKLFRHFYILVVCYIYFTRIIVYLMKITLPFKLVWLTDLFLELAMMVFFVVTGSKFRPATDNPYLQVPQDSDEEELEMEEVLTKTGSTENVVRVNQKTEGATNQIKQRGESSHDYD
ncbi:protein GPR107-like [Babylonia areolata]|uniref:protein GPR107-like n=1 Tax=Babylonia areolata TaxID=304850 RepID=UPI003FD16FDA